MISHKDTATRPASYLQLQWWQGVGVILLAGYFWLLFSFEALSPRHLFLGVVVFGLIASGRSRVRQFLLDWVPLLLFWVVYDMLRVIVNHSAFGVELYTPYRFDQVLFGWLFGGKIPAHWFTDWFRANPQGPAQLALHTFSSGVYMLHFFVFPLYMFYAWLRRQRDVFYTFSLAFALLHLAAVLTYIFYPAAPPWWLYYQGFVAPAADYVTLASNVPSGVFDFLWKINPNYFAAVPSLHAAYPAMLLLLLGHRGRRLRALLLAYLGGVWFATIFLNHHFVFDLLVGAAYALGAVWLTRRVLYPRVIAPRLALPVAAAPAPAPASS